MNKDIVEKGFKNWLVQFGLFWFIIVYTCMKVYSIIKNGLTIELQPILLIKEISVWLTATIVLSWLIWKIIVKKK